MALQAGALWVSQPDWETCSEGGAVAPNAQARPCQAMFSSQIRMGATTGMMVAGTLRFVVSSTGAVVGAADLADRPVGDHPAGGSRPGQFGESQDLDHAALSSVHDNYAESASVAPTVYACPS